MIRKVRGGLLGAAVVLLAVALPLAVVPPASAQGTPTDTLASYLDKMGVSWKRSEKNADLLIVTKTTGLSRAEKVEIYVYNNPKDSWIELLAYPLIGGKYLAVSSVSDRTGLMRKMLEANADAFGGYFIDDEGDVGFKFDIASDSGVGYETFRAVVMELLRIADEAVVKMVNSYR